jgi:multicomponent Na+:H+ antiporter subunit F
MFAVAMAGVLVTMVLVLVRAVKGPTVYDRLLAANVFGTSTILLIAVAGFLTGRPEWLDLAIVYACVSFTGVIAVAKYARFGNLARDDRRRPPL